MAEVVIPIPKGLEEDKSNIERKLRELVELEVKKKMLAKLFDELMKGSKQLSDDELVKLGRKVKEGRFEKLRKMGLV